MEDERVGRSGRYYGNDESQALRWEMEICPKCGGQGMMCKCWVDALIDHCEKPDAEKEDIRAELMAQYWSGPFIRKFGSRSFQYPYEGCDAAGTYLQIYLNEPPASLFKLKEAFIELMEAVRIEMEAGNLKAIEPIERGTGSS